MFLKECKYVAKKTYKFINDEIEIYSNDSDRESSNVENSNEEN